MAPGCGTIAIRESDRPADAESHERYGDDSTTRPLAPARSQRHERSPRHVRPGSHLDYVSRQAEKAIAGCDGHELFPRLWVSALDQVMPVCGLGWDDAESDWRVAVGWSAPLRQSVDY